MEGRCGGAGGRDDVAVHGGLLVLSVLLVLYAGDGQGWVQRVQQGTTGYDRYRYNTIQYRYRYTKQRYTNSDTACISGESVEMPLDRLTVSCRR